MGGDSVVAWWGGDLGLFTHTRTDGRTRGARDLLDHHMHDAAAACAANVVISIASTCLYYRLLWALQPYPAFAVQLGALMQVIVCGAALALLEWTRWAPCASQPAVSGRLWMELALWLSLQDTLEIAAVDGLGSSNGDLTPVLQQAVVPLTLGLSIVLLGRRYSWLHWMAAVAVLVGIACSYAPIAVSSETGQLPWGWAALYAASRIPQSLANVRCESVLQAAGAAPGAESVPTTPPRLRLLHLVLRASFFTALLGLVLNVPSSLLLALARGREAGTVFGEYVDGARCLLSYNVTAGDDADGEAAAGACDGTAAQAAAAFALPGVLFAVSEFHVLREASAATYFLLLALELPLQAAVLAAPWVMGHLASAYHPSLLGGVPIIMAGLAAWAHAERRVTRAKWPLGDVSEPMAASAHATPMSLTEQRAVAHPPVGWCR